MNLETIRELISHKINEYNKNITLNLSSDVALINQINNYIIYSGGKRLRPLLVLLLSEALNYQGKDDIDLASVIEFIHTATLLHDDVVDNSELRRGEKTANNTFGNSASILSGDFLYSRAFQLMVKMNSMKIMNILAQATNKIAEGEVLQLLNCNNHTVTEKQYMDVIYSKTAKLFESACESIGIIANLSEEKLQQLKNYGKHLGNAFQLADDIMDFTSDAKTMGKNIGDDITEGKATLPIIHSLQKITETDQKSFLINVIKNGCNNEINKVVEILISTGSIIYTKEKAILESKKAKSCISFLPKSKYKNALLSICDLSIHRLV